MTARACITKTELRRRIEAITAAGLGVTEIRPDGTIIVGRPVDPDLPDRYVPTKNAAELALEQFLSNEKG